MPPAAASPQPSSRRIWQYASTAGGIENNLQLAPAAPLPPRRRDEHLIRVEAAALNPVDYKPAEAPGVGWLAVRKPATPGVDIAGRILAAAEGSGLAPGQLVFGGAGAGAAAFAAGGLAEVVAAPARMVAAVPEGVAAAQAAGVPVAGLAAYQALVPRVRAGDRVLVVGGAGGVGSFAVQLARLLGCRVTATCSARNVAACREDGAEEVIDYTAVDVPTALAAAAAAGGEDKRFALVVDTVGHDPQLYWRCHEFTLPGASFVLVGRSEGLASLAFSIKAHLWPSFLGGGRRKIVMFFTQPNMKDLEALAEWLQQGKIKVHIDSRFPFEQVPDAFRRLKTGRARGKIIVDVASADT